MGRLRAESLPQKERLRKRKEFLRVYQAGEKIASGHFFLYVLKNDHPHHRFGVTVSRKIGKPVVRNSIKRLLREVFRRNKSIISPASDLVFNVKRSAAGASYADLAQDFLAAAKSWNRHKGE